jgi:predicted nuclease of predicted toxin-antitoxin system
MKLLFDQNLSPRLPRLLADLYPDSAHIRELGMRDATDTQIWEYAKSKQFSDSITNSPRAVSVRRALLQ